MVSATRMHEGAIVNGQSLQFDLLLPQGANSELAKLGPAACWQVIEDTTRRAEDLGYRGVWAFDRLDPVPRRGTAPVFDGWTTLSALAKVSERLRLGLVSSPAPHRDVLQLAKHAATLDVISGGRAALALDGAYRVADAGDNRGPVDLDAGVVETAEALRRLWAGGAASYEGKYVRLDKAFSHPWPVQSPLPVLALSDTERNARTSAFDGSIRRGDPDTLREAVSADPTAPPMVFLDCRLFDNDLERDRWLSSPHVILFWSDHPDVYMRRNLAGTTEAVTRQLQRYVDAGITEFGIYFRDYPTGDSAWKFMVDVVPALTQPAGDLDETAPLTAA
jgi:alkanesulfonate monooxygenase SsuD/methylene tetrahydromethanopterin reductase-like flavin-dependent oxidoreductase (luciferase family)